MKAVSILHKLGFHSPNTIVKSNSQGTLSKIFFFDNIYLAIVWINRYPTFYSDRLPTKINFPARANWQQTQASPFGIGLSRKPRKNIILNRNLVESLVIDNNIYYFARNQKNILEPLIFLLPDSLSFKQLLNLNPAQTKKFTNHPLGVRKITDIKIVAQKGKRRNSEALDLVTQNDIVKIDRNNIPSQFSSTSQLIAAYSQ